MRLFLPLFASILATVASAQPITSLSPAANARHVPRTAPVEVALASPPAPGATLKVFSSLVGGLKSGTLSVVGTTVRFTPAVAYAAGETLTAVFTAGTGGGHVWQFTAAATGTGQFGSGSDLPFAAYPYGSTLLSIAAGDLTGDGNIDVVAREIGTNPSPLFITNDAGQLVNAGKFVLGATYSWQMIPPIGDLNGDGLLDLTPGLNVGDAQFSYAANPTYIPRSMYDGTLADLDADGDLDYVYTYSSNIYTYSPALHVATNGGTGSLATPAAQLPVADAGFLSSGDLDGDGALDLVLLSGGSLAVLHNNGRGAFTKTFSRAIFTDSFYANHAVAIGDLDGDGDLDLLVPMQLHIPPGGNAVFSTDIWLNDGQGSFTRPAAGAATASDLGGSSSVALGDLDGDGDLDALLATRSGEIRLYYNNGQGIFAFGYSVPGINGANGALLADMNKDGSLDIVAAKSGATPGDPGTGQPGVLSVRLNGYAALATQQPQAGSPWVWPNPVASGQTLHVGGALGSVATLRTLLGQPVAAATLAGATSELATTGLAAGLYLLTLEPANHLPRTYRIVVE